MSGFFEDFQEKSPLRQIPTEKSGLGRRNDKFVCYHSQIYLSAMQCNDVLKNIQKPITDYKKLKIKGFYLFKIQIGSNLELRMLWSTGQVFAVY